MHLMFSKQCDFFPTCGLLKEFHMVQYWVSVKRGAPLNIVPTPLTNTVLPPKVTTYRSQCSINSQSVNPPLEFQRGRRGSKLWDIECGCCIKESEGVFVFFP